MFIQNLRMQSYWRYVFVEIASESDGLADEECPKKRMERLVHKHTEKTAV